MTLEAVIQDKASIPAGLETHYKEIDGKFVLDVPGMKTQSDFDNYAEALKKRFTDASSDFARNQGSDLDRNGVIDIVDKAFQKFTAGLKPANGNGDGQGDGVDAQRLHDLERNVASLTEERDKLVTERDTAVTNTRDTTIRNVLTEAATASGVKPEGVANLVNLTSHNFEIAQDGTVVTKLEAGDGVSPNEKPEDYFSNIARDKSYRMFWPPSKGAGADGDGGGGGSGDLSAGNPWTKAGWNLTKQGQVFRSDKAEAERLASAAGVKIGAIAAVR